MRTSTYRMRAGRFLGVLAVGLIILGIAAVSWAFGLPPAVVTVFLVLGGLVALAGLWILARPPVLLKLDPDAVEVRGVRIAWVDVTEVGQVATTHGQAIALRTQRGEDPQLIPLRWLSPAGAGQVQQELRERLNSANGYTSWDGLPVDATTDAATDPATSPAEKPTTDPAADTDPATGPGTGPGTGPAAGPDDRAE